MLVDASQLFSAKPKKRASRSDATVRNAQLLRLIDANCADLLSVENRKDEFTFVSANIVELFGWSPQELLGRSLYTVVHEGDLEQVKTQRALHAHHLESCTRFRLRCKSGAYRWVESRSRLGASEPYTVTMTRDIDEDVHRIEELERIATYDSLTNILNRRAIELALDTELQRSRRHSKALAVALFDIDRFKQVNDSHGHHVGDLVLKSVSECVERNKRRYDVLGRWGGDEFLLILPETRIEEAEHVLDRIRSRVTQEAPGVTLCFGITSNSAAETVHGLVVQADTALYQGKRRGGNQVRRWEVENLGA
jgi:diguanylate cyclase (GGDEF)-like protein/PAS domain S-box-containing protein